MASPDPADVLTAALDLLNPPEWHVAALCRRSSVNFFPGRGESLEPARALCRRCPVRDDCLQDAIDSGQQHGVWGGYSDGQRKQLMRRPAAA